jgi:hypothetical protein
MPIHGRGVQHVVTATIIVSLTVLVIALGNLAGLGPPEWPSLNRFFSFGHHGIATYEAPCKAPNQIGSAACPTHRYHGSAHPRQSPVGSQP